MAIASAVQRGSVVHVFNERGVTMFTISGTLVGFTASTVTVKRGSNSFTCNDRGVTMFSK